MKAIAAIIFLLIFQSCTDKTGTKTHTVELPLIDSLWDYNKPEETHEKFKALIPEAQSDPNYYLELLTQIARTQSLQGNFDEAHAILDSVQRKFNEEMANVRIRYHLERGRTFNSSGEKDKATKQFHLANDLAVENEQDFYAVDAVHMLAISDSPETHLSWNLKAMEMAEASQDPRAKKWLGSLYNNIGWTYHDQGEFEKALAQFEKGLLLRKEQKDADGARIAKWTIARTYRSLDRVENALAIQMDLLKEIESTGAAPDGYVYEEIGECLILQDKKEEAAPYFKQAYDLISQDKWMVANEAERLERMKLLAN